MDKKTIRTVAIHLPQFHPIPENDEWWGKGFTEWTNVVKAKARFDGHYQPHLPADLGFYDLRLEEARLAQEALAKEYGVYGFCYYHYWFNGKRVLHEPVDRKLKNPNEDLPFMLCWANENWTRAWDGSEQHILFHQHYSEEDDRAHIKHLLTYFRDERYIRVDGKPVFIFYKPDLFPDMKRTVEIFREEAGKEKMELYLCWFDRWIGWHGNGHEDSGFDAAIEFQPLSRSFRKFHHEKVLAKTPLIFRNRIAKKIISAVKKTFPFFNTSKKTVKKDDLVFDYSEFVDYDLAMPQPPYKCYPGANPMWDNSSRRVGQSALLFTRSTPALFKKWYHAKCNKFQPFSQEENFIFINAWNEWAEGNHLEPCQKWGKQYLEALK